MFKKYILLVKFWIYAICFMVAVDLSHKQYKIYETYNQAFNVSYITRVDYKAPDKKIINGYIISKKDLRSALKRKFPNAEVILTDLNSLSVSKQYFTRFIMPNFKKETEHLYFSSKFDCDDFSSILKIYFQVFHSNIRNPSEAPSIGEFYYRPDSTDNPLSGHAINILVDVELDKNNKPQLVFWFVEPQAGVGNCILDLSYKEMDSCVFIKF